MTFVATSLPHLDRGGTDFKLHARDFTVLLLRVRPFPHLEYIVTVFLDAPLAFVNVRLVWYGKTLGMRIDATSVAA